MTSPGPARFKSRLQLCVAGVDAGAIAILSVAERKHALSRQPGVIFGVDEGVRVGFVIRTNSV